MFQRAVRGKAKAKIAIAGPSGSGKTLSALLIARGLGEKIAFIDTENSSGELYADNLDKGIDFPFDHMNIEPPYTVEKYEAAIKGAAHHGYDVVIIDSLSHAWAGEGGLLEKKSKADARGGNSFTNWKNVTPEQERFKSTILTTNIHVIGTKRSKQAHVIEVNEGGKQSVKKLGMAPIQRGDLEYEFTVSLNMAMNHTAQASKDRSGLFGDETGYFVFTPTKATGEKIRNWLASGAEPKAVVVPEVSAKDLQKELYSLITSTGMKKDQALAIYSEIAEREVKATADLTVDELKIVILKMKDAAFLAEKFGVEAA